jgi:predicted aspartyl protease
MGYVHVHATIANSTNHDLKMEREFIVDKGAIYTVISRKVAEAVKLKELGKRRFRTGSGIVELPVAEAYLTVGDEGITTLVAIAHDEDTPLLLGVTTLELLGLQVDPVNGKLKPLELLIL